MAEKKFNGDTYRTSPLTAKEALALYVDLMRIGGKAANRLPAIIIALSADDEGEAAMADVAALAAIADILKSTPTDEVVSLVERILGCADVLQPSGTWRTLDFDGDFTGHLGNLFPVVRWILSEQYADFFIGKGRNGILGMFRDSLRKPK